jgi:glycosyltransferase involved in cell wall biosynthesis
MKKVLLIIPCYNEGERFNQLAFATGIKILHEMNIELSFLFANDGSKDNTRELLNNFCANHPRCYVHHIEANSGKANVIQKTFHSKKDELNLKSYEWIGYWDADLATPLEEISRMIKFLDFYPQEQIDTIWGSRISRLGSDIKRQMHRHYLGRIFVTIVSNVLKVRAYDSQCGAKLFTPSAAGKAFSEPFISRWIFDVEILLRLQNQKIIEFPLFHWRDVPGSKVKVFKEIFKVGRDLWRIRSKYKTIIDKNQV